MTNSVYDREYKEIVKRLANARQETGLTQKEVANKLSKPQSYISKIESGERRLDVVEFKKLIRIYKKSADYFIK